MLETYSLKDKSGSGSTNALLVYWLRRLPFKEETAGSIPVESASRFCVKGDTDVR